MNLRSILVAVLLPLGALAQTGDAGLAPTAPDTEASASSQKAYFASLKVGLFEPTSALKGSAFGGLELGYFPGWLDQHLALALEGDLYRPALSSSISSPQLTFGGQTASGAYRLTEREAAVLLSAQYYFSEVLGGLGPYVGAGPGYYWHQAKTTAFGTTNTETEGSLGLQVLAGAQYRLGPGSAFLEFHYHWTQVDFLATGKANVGGLLAFSLGYRVAF